MNNKTVCTLKLLFGGMSVFMVGLVIVTCMKSDLFHLPPELVNAPWFQTTLVDFYFNIAILSLWVMAKESSRLKMAVWIIAFILLGSIATCFYVLLQLLKLKPEEPWQKIFVRS